MRCDDGERETFQVCFLKSRKLTGQQELIHMRKEWNCIDGLKWFLYLEDWRFRMRVGHLRHRNLQV